MGRGFESLQAHFEIKYDFEFYIMVGIAQLVSAPDCGSGGPGFESLYPPYFPGKQFRGFFVFYERLDLKFDREVKVETQIINGYYFTERYPGDEY